MSSCYYYALKFESQVLGLDGGANQARQTGLGGTMLWSASVGYAKPGYPNRETFPGALSLGDGQCQSIKGLLNPVKAITF